MTRKPYYETVRDVYIRAAVELYKAAVESGDDPDHDDASGYLRRGNEMRDKALETWPLSTRQERHLYRWKARAEAATPEGRELKQRIIDQLNAS